MKLLFFFVVLLQSTCTDDDDDDADDDDDDDDISRKRTSSGSLFIRNVTYTVAIFIVLYLVLKFSAIILKRAVYVKKGSKANEHWNSFCTL